MKTLQKWQEGTLFILLIFTFQTPFYFDGSMNGEPVHRDRNISKIKLW